MSLLMHRPMDVYYIALRMKTIIVPCDFSAPSRAAYAFAMAMAERTGSQVVAVYVIYIPVLFDPITAGGLPIPYDTDFLERMELQANEQFEEMKRAVAHSSVHSKLSIVNGSVVFALLAEITHYQASLVIMGTTGTSATQENWIGSTTEKMVRHCRVPVISVHKNMSLQPIKKILLPSVLGLNQTAFINKVKEVQEIFGATLELLLINTPSHFFTEPEAKEKFDEFIEHYHLSHVVTHFKSFRTEEEGIRHMASQEDIGLVALATHARKGIAHVLQGSITEKVVNHLPCPVWTMEMKDERHH